MRLGVISEMTSELGKNPSDVIEALEEFVDDNQGKLTPQHVRDITTYLSRFTPNFLKRVASLLGTSDYTPNGMARQIADGALIAYVGDVPKFDPQITTKSYSDVDESHPDYYIDGPGREELDAIEAQEAGRVQGYRSRPPAFKAQDGGSPAVAQIPDQLAYRLKSLSPADLIDNPPTQPVIHQPFIYVSGSEPKLFVGSKGGYHDSIMQELSDPVEQRLIQNVYTNGDYDENYDYIPGSAHPGVVGRIGYNFAKMDPSLRNTVIATMYAKKGATEHPQMLAECTRALVQGGYIPHDALIVYAGQLTSAAEVLGGTETKLSEQDIMRSQLQAAYHVGTWPNGKRMTPEEKADLGRKLGLTSGGMKKNPWQANMEKAGIINPGQRWWAPTSESKGK